MNDNENLDAETLASFPLGQYYSCMVTDVTRKGRCPDSMGKGHWTSVLGSSLDSVPCVPSLADFNLYTFLVINLNCESKSFPGFPEFQQFIKPESVPEEPQMVQLVSEMEVVLGPPDPRVIVRGEVALGTAPSNFAQAGSHRWASRWPRKRAQVVLWVLTFPQSCSDPGASQRKEGLLQPAEDTRASAQDSFPAATWKHDSCPVQSVFEYAECQEGTAEVSNKTETRTCR